MFTITWIENGELFSISTPGMRTAAVTFYTIGKIAKRPARLWHSSKGKQTMIF